MRISDWSSDVCSSDLPAGARAVDGRFGARPRLSGGAGLPAVHRDALRPRQSARRCPLSALRSAGDRVMSGRAPKILGFGLVGLLLLVILTGFVWLPYDPLAIDLDNVLAPPSWAHRSEEHTSELQSLMRISYAVFCLKKKTKYKTQNHSQRIK